MVAIKESEEHFGKSSQLALAGGAEEACELLDKARAVLKKKLSFFVWQGFFEPLVAVSLCENNLSLEAPTLFHKNWVVDHYMGELVSAVCESSGHEIKIKVTYSTEKNTPKATLAKKIKTPKESSKNNSKIVKNMNQTLQEQEDINPEKAPVLPIAISTISNTSSSQSTFSLPSNINPKYNFEAYVQGPSNQMGYAAALSVADHPGAQFSPLFLFGGVGLGKTHLLHAIGMRAKEKNPTLRVVYLSAEQWVNSYIQSIRERQFDSFRNRYRLGCDILLIDDIQFLAGKDASQDEFFHTFNSLHEARKQIVVTSDKYPHEIEGLEERLQTRLSWGLIADIRPPEIETRIAILHKKAQSLSIKLSDEVLNFLAANVKNSVRELEGALVRLSACSNLSKGALSIESTKKFLAPVIKKNKVNISWQHICDVVASYYDLAKSEILGKSRQRQVVFARQVAMSLCRTLLALSLPEIGRIFGGRDHSTVFASVRKIDDLLRADVSFQSLLHKLELKIRDAAQKDK